MFQQLLLPPCLLSFPSSRNNFLSNHLLLASACLCPCSRSFRLNSSEYDPRFFSRYFTFHPRSSDSLRPNSPIYSISHLPVTLNPRPGRAILQKCCILHITSLVIEATIRPNDMMAVYYYRPRIAAYIEGCITHCSKCTVHEESLLPIDIPSGKRVPLEAFNRMYWIDFIVQLPRSEAFDAIIYRFGR